MNHIGPRVHTFFVTVLLAAMTAGTFAAPASAASPTQAPGTPSGNAIDAPSRDPLEGASLTVLDEKGTEAEAGAISGRVVDAAGEPLPGMFVSALGNPGGSGFASTDIDGRYTLTDLPQGDYRISFSGAGFATEYFDNTSDRNEATLVTVTADAGAGGVDAALEKEAVISGRVVDASGLPLSGVFVSLTGSAGYFGASTGADGRYYVSSLPAASYKVHFSKAGYAAEYFDSAPDLDSATAVVVAAGDSRTDVDASLDVPGHISGQVLDHNGEPLAGASVWASGPATGTSITDSDGRYILEVPANSGYIVYFYGDSANSGEYYDGVRTIQEATPIAVAAGDTTSGIDAQLARAYSISGVVTDATTGERLDNDGLGVAFYDAQGQDLMGDGVFDGEFSFTGFGSGDSYYVQIIDYDGIYTSQFWKNASTIGDATLVVVGEENIELSFALKPRASVVSGDVSISGEPIVGETLTAQPGEWSPAPVELAYQWLADGEPILGATRSTLKLTEDLIGASVTLSVTGSRPGYEPAARTGVTEGNVRWASTPSLPASSPVYRFWSPKNQTHFYTMSAQERDVILATYPASIWTYEGERYQAFSTQVPGSVPLYRFWSPRLSGHFFTTNESEKDSVIRDYDDWTWTYEGIAYYVYPIDSTVPNTVPVARFWSPTNQHHFYTASAQEAEVVKGYPARIWTYEGDNYRVPITVAQQ